ncbi:uncharacterized protein LOC131657941 [Vicia villosa]|uniref:uncharacterized protein LOC131657941 n=1 Tax=Vicia villosa TaxID=3911 RepID=UPI00273C2660|nr:uncharacterized protein LOC131657941 [Vicia villosa]
MVCDWWTTQGWSVKASIQVALPKLLSTISSIVIPNFNVEDKLVWKSNTNGELSFKTAYNIITKPSPSKFRSNFPWDKDSPPSQSMVVWRYIHRKLPTHDSYVIRGFSLPSMCSLCHSSQETMDRLFFGCKFATNLWKWLKLKCGINFNFQCYNDCLKLLDFPWSAQALSVLKSSFVGIFYHTWRSRNKVRQENLRIHCQSCVASVAAQAKMAGNTSCRKSNSTISSFAMLKKFDVNLNPRNSSTFVDVLWSPPLQGWIKYNVDGVAKGSP